MSSNCLGYMLSGCRFSLLRVAAFGQLLKRQSFLSLAASACRAYEKYGAGPFVSNFGLGYFLDPVTMDWRARCQERF